MPLLPRYRKGVHLQNNMAVLSMRPKGGNPASKNRFKLGEHVGKSTDMHKPTHLMQMNE